MTASLNPSSKEHDPREAKYQYGVGGTNSQKCHKYRRACLGRCLFHRNDCSTFRR
jgi:hypothetical protein